MATTGFEYIKRGKGNLQGLVKQLLPLIEVFDSTDK